MLQRGNKYKSDVRNYVRRRRASAQVKRMAMGKSKGSTPVIKGMEVCVDRCAGRSVPYGWLFSE